MHFSNLGEVGLVGKIYYKDKARGKLITPAQFLVTCPFMASGPGALLGLIFIKSL